MMLSSISASNASKCFAVDHFEYMLLYLFARAVSFTSSTARSNHRAIASLAGFFKRTLSSIFLDPIERDDLTLTRRFGAVSVSTILSEPCMQSTVPT